MEIEETRKHEIETLAARFTKRLTLLRNLTEPLATELADERIKSSTAGSTCGEGRSKEAEYRLGDRMAGFETTFTAREDRIKKLFTQWQRVQGRIIMLAVKIYGRDAVYLIPDQIYPNMEKHFAEAAKEHESLSEQQRKRSNGIDELEKGVLEMSKQTKEQVNAIHQVSPETFAKFSSDVVGSSSRMSRSGGGRSWNEHKAQWTTSIESAETRKFSCVSCHGESGPSYVPLSLEANTAWCILLTKFSSL